MPPPPPDLPLVVLHAYLPALHSPRTTPIGPFVPLPRIPIMSSVPNFRCAMGSTVICPSCRGDTVTLFCNIKTLRLHELCRLRTCTSLEDNRDRYAKPSFWTRHSSTAGRVSSSSSSSDPTCYLITRHISRGYTTRIYIYRSPPPPFQARSFEATSLYAVSIYYLKGQKVSFFSFDLSPTIRIFFLWFLSLRAFWE